MNPVSDAAIADLLAAVAGRLLASGQRLVTAESCTGGWIAKACTDLPGSSRWFRGGVVAYDNDLKVRLLGVDPRSLDASGAVSEAVVREMAAGALERLGGDLAVAVTGIAGPDGGSESRPVGSVWFGWAQRRGGRIELQTALDCFKGDRDAVRRQAVIRGLRGLLGA